MKRRGLSSQGLSRSLILAALVVMVANAVALLDVARNRTRRLQTIELTERELPIGYQREDNSGIEMRLTLASEGPLVGLGLEWLDAVKLRELGIEMRPLAGDNSRQPPARPVYLALEYDGPAWQHYLEEARKRFPDMVPQNTASHLIVVDAARTPEVLLARYGSTGRHLIVRGTLATMASRSIVDVMPREIHVSLPLANALQRFARHWEAEQIPRYTVRLAYGIHYEPWVETVTVKP
jgi:hypothetical protein